MMKRILYWLFPPIGFLGAVAGVVGIASGVQSLFGDSGGDQQRSNADASTASAGRYYDALADISKEQWDQWKETGLPLLKSLTGMKADATDRTAEMEGKAADDVKTQFGIARQNTTRALDLARNPGDPGYADIMASSFGNEAAQVAGAVTNARALERERLAGVERENFARALNISNLWKGLPADANAGLSAAGSGQNRNAAIYTAQAGQADQRAAQGAYGGFTLAANANKWFNGGLPGPFGTPPINNEPLPTYSGSNFDAGSYTGGSDPGYSDLYAKGGAIRGRPYYRDGRVVYAEGGKITGPGTGTSDSIATEKQPGTYILSADTVRAVGTKKLHDLMEKAGVRPGHGGSSDGAGVPVRLSNGEWSMPPEVTDYYGEEFFNNMQKKFHRPVYGAEGNANGGAVRRRALPHAVEEAIYGSMRKRAIGRSV